MGIYILILIGETRALTMRVLKLCNTRALKIEKLMEGSCKLC